MTPNNHERMRIVLSMKRPFDYAEFLQICEDSSVQPLLIGEYAMKVGYLQMAKIKYPDMAIEEAYQKFVMEDVNTQQLPQGQGCSSCGDKKDKPLPSLLTQAGNLVSGVGHHIADGLANIDEKTLEIRNNICDTCENMRSDGRCSECGCMMKIKAKWESASCPVKKW